MAGCRSDTAIAVAPCYLHLPLSAVSWNRTYGTQLHLPPTAIQPARLAIVISTNRD